MPVQPAKAGREPRVMDSRGKPGPRWAGEDLERMAGPRHAAVRSGGGTPKAFRLSFEWITRPCSGRC